MKILSNKYRNKIPSYRKLKASQIKMKFTMLIISK